MTANRALARQRGISYANVEEIDRIHLEIKGLIEEYSVGSDYDAYLCAIMELEYRLQYLWDFSQDRNFHTWGKRLEDKAFSLQWAGRSFQCMTTGAVATIPDTTYQGQMIHISGSSSIDLGRFEAYHRMLGDIKELNINER